MVELWHLTQHRNGKQGGEQRNQIRKKSRCRRPCAAHPFAPETVGQNGRANHNEQHGSSQLPAGHEHQIAHGCLSAGNQG